MFLTDLDLDDLNLDEADHTISFILCVTATLKNIYFWKFSGSIL